MMIDGERVKRYKEKLIFIEKRDAQVKEWIDPSPIEEILEDEKTKLAIYKAFQEVVEGCMDLVTMVLKDLGFPPKDDYSNIETLYANDFIQKWLRDLLAEANGLRNWVVHRYNKLDDILALERIKEVTPQIKEFGVVIRKWLKKVF